MHLPRTLLFHPSVRQPAEVAVQACKGSNPCPHGKGQKYMTTPNSFSTKACISMVQTNIYDLLERLGPLQAKFALGGVGNVPLAGDPCADISSSLNKFLVQVSIWPIPDEACLQNVRFNFLKPALYLPI